MAVIWIVAGCSLIAWLALLVARGMFWIAVPRLDPTDADGVQDLDVPSVTAVIPARNESAVLSLTLPSILNQEYPGPFHVILVDDRSTDGTGEIAQSIIAEHSSTNGTVIAGAPRPADWVGKVWAMQQGVAHIAASSSDYIWFTDADIAHAPGVLTALVSKAQQEGRDLVSLMASLRVDSWWDRLLVPAFVYFFAKLYPFRFVNNPRRPAAGAAGGCMLVSRQALAASGGLAAMRDALIDDCALARLLKRNNRRIWLAFTHSVASVRAYGTLESIWDMVARSAFHQLRYSWIKLTGTVTGMLLLYVFPPLLTFLGILLRDPVTAAIGGATWSIQSLSFLPILAHQGTSRWIAPLLPLAGILYTAMTVSSAMRHVTGRSKAWRGPSN